MRFPCLKLSPLLWSHRAGLADPQGTLQGTFASRAFPGTVERDITEAICSVPS